MISIGQRAPYINLMILSLRLTAPRRASCPRYTTALRHSILAKRSRSSVQACCLHSDFFCQIMRRTIVLPVSDPLVLNRAARFSQCRAETRSWPQSEKIKPTRRMDGQSGVDSIVGRNVLQWIPAEEISRNPVVVINPESPSISSVKLSRD